MVEWIDLFDTFLSGILPIIGSVLVAYLYISNENKKNEKKEFKLFLNNFYIENGILKVEEYISKYGRSTTFALLDLINYSKRVYLENEPNTVLQDGIDEIKDRTMITDLLVRNYDSVLDHCAYLSQFGNIFEKIILKVIQLYSDLLRQTLDYSNLLRNFQVAPQKILQINNSNLTPQQKTLLIEQERQIRIKETINGLNNATGLTDSIVGYLISRLEYLKRYLLINDPSDYSDLLDITTDEMLKPLHDDLDMFHHHLLNYVTSLRNATMHQGIAAGNVRLYISENLDTNPLADIVIEKRSWTKRISNIYERIWTHRLGIITFFLYFPVHELGHILMARIDGVSIIDYKLIPSIVKWRFIGGYVTVNEFDFSSIDSLLFFTLGGFLLTVIIGLVGYFILYLTNSQYYKYPYMWIFLAWGASSFDFSSLGRIIGNPSYGNILGFGSGLVSGVILSLYFVETGDIRRLLRYIGEKPK